MAGPGEPGGPPDVGARLSAEAAQKLAPGGSKGWAAGAINKGAQIVNPQACGFDKPIFGGGGLLKILGDGGAFTTKAGAPSLLKNIAASIREDAAKAAQGCQAIYAGNITNGAPADNGLPRQFSAGGSQTNLIDI